MGHTEEERTIIRWERLKAKADKLSLFLKMDFSREPCRMAVSDDKGPMLVSRDLTEIEGFLKGVDAFCRQR